MIVPKEIDSNLPTDTQNPKLYERAVNFLGAVAVLAVIASAVLTGMDKNAEGLITLGAGVAGYIGGMLLPRKGA